MTAPLKFRHIFIVTYARSGSTLLAGLIGSIPGVWMRGENANVAAHLARAAAAAAYASKMTARRKDNAIHPWFGASSIDVKAFRGALAGAFVSNVLKPPPDAIACGFKEIRHGLDAMSDSDFDAYIDFLLTAFDRPCVIFNVRDRRDVARSGLWLGRTFVRKYVRECDRRFRRNLARHPAATYLVNYNKYARSPKRLRGLFDFLGAEFDRARIDRVLNTEHSFQNAGKVPERLRAARSVTVGAMEALTLAVRRRLIG